MFSAWEALDKNSSNRDRNSVLDILVTFEVLDKNTSNLDLEVNAKYPRHPQNLMIQRQSYFFNLLETVIIKGEEHYKWFWHIVKMVRRQNFKLNSVKILWPGASLLRLTSPTSSPPPYTCPKPPNAPRLLCRQGVPRHWAQVKRYSFSLSSEYAFPRYQYQYAVTDDYTKSNFQAQEERDGFSTLGSYRWDVCFWNQSRLDCTTFDLELPLDKSFHNCDDSGWHFPMAEFRLSPTPQIRWGRMFCH